MLAIRKFLCVVASISLCGCGTTALKSVKVDAGPLHDSAHVGLTSVVYALPKTVLKITIPYTIVRSKSFKDGKQQGDEAITTSITKPILITPVLASDENNLFKLEMNGGTGNPFMDADLSVKMSAQGLVSTFSSDFTDRGPEAVQTIISTVAKVAVGVAALFYERPLLVKTHLAKRLTRRGLGQSPNLGFGQDAFVHGYRSSADRA
ncbi:MAG TPA: hypothetical protein VHD56_11225, partial [Tepidisphaeraceae bacterium]|nr:hypothetical protein [Tepidisphaeraceae bacterium]